ncbi:MULTISPECIES: SIS domain-containing protein [unclassified Streptomyces]|uniref:D-sedoheptulose-7-phosphate isomerase n=1 Tax=unclassified Streptomyces TaxID=2593676 RepID=UPI0033B80A34
MQHYQWLSERFFSNTVDGLGTVSLPAVADAVEALDGVRRRGGRVYAMGNGGSATTATHLVCDLVKTARRPTEPPLRAFALADNIALLTAYANDVSYADAFVRQLTDNAEPGDAVVAISASGRSPNIVAALRAARRMGLVSIGMLGCGGGPAAELVDIPLVVGSDDFGVIETAHIAIVHAFADVLRASGPGAVGVPERVGAGATARTP